MRSPARSLEKSFLLFTAIDVAQVSFYRLSSVFVLILSRLMMLHARVDVVSSSARSSVVT